MLRDIVQNKDPSIDAAAQVIATVSPDVLLLTNFDWDRKNRAASAFIDRLNQLGATYPFVFSRRPNTGIPTGFDIDQNGYFGDARDAQGFGYFSGYAGMVLLSKFPIVDEKARNFSDFLWKDLPDANLPHENGAPFPSSDVYDVQRLSTTGHWVVPIDTPMGAIAVLAHFATPPVFDGPEDRNGRRNADELLFWTYFLDQEFGPVPDEFVILMSANLDPNDGDGLSSIMYDFLRAGYVTDPNPARVGYVAEANIGHKGDPKFDTVNWNEPAGNLRVDYALPASSLSVVDAGVFWPNDASILGVDGNAAGRHRLVWVELSR